MRFECDLITPSAAQSGVPFTARVRISGGPSAADAELTITRREGQTVAHDSTRLASDGTGYVALPLTLQKDANAGHFEAVILVATVTADGERSMPDAESVVVFG